MATTSLINSIEKKISRLIAENTKLREERVKLQETREKLKADNRELTERTAELERRIAVLELQRGFAGGEGDTKSTKAAKMRLNRLMREVDRCLALLNK